MTEDTKAVFVANISPNATEKTVSDFFSFCGRITKLTLRKEPTGDGSQEAIVVFETDSAAKTALLLTNALIVDRPITVVPHVSTSIDTEGAPTTQTEVPQENITNRTFTAPDHERSKTSVVASMLAAGYVLGTDSVAKAREFDEKHMISLQLKVGAEQVKAKANEIDKALHISETANVIKTVTIEKAKEVDEKLKITENVNKAADAVKQQASAFATKASENEVVAKGVGLLQSVGASIQQSFQSLKDETMASVEEKRSKEQGGSPTITPITTTTTDPTEPIIAPLSPELTTPSAPVSETPQ
jgi:uncharacterized protein YdaT